MRISIPIDVWDPARGGAERYLARLARELEARGHEVTILCLQCVKGESDLAGIGPRVEILDVPRFPRWLRELRFASAVVRAHRASGRGVLFQIRHALEADVYQPHGGSYLASRSAQGGALSSARRLLRNAFACVRPSHQVLRRLDRAVFEKSPNVITLSVSSRVEEDFRRTYPDLQFRFERIHNPVDSEQFHDRDRAECRARLLQRYAIPPEKRIALFAAHNFRPKGLAFAVEALREASDWHLVIAGRGSAGPFLRLAHRLGVGERTHFVGAVDDLRSVYAGVEAFVLPTFYDPCSLSVLEALACGVPAITTRANGASDLIVDGVSGFILDRPEDVAAISRALRAAASRWDVLHAGARSTGLQLGWKDHMNRLEFVLCQVGRRT